MQTEIQKERVASLKLAFGWLIRAAHEGVDALVEGIRDEEYAYHSPYRPVCISTLSAIERYSSVRPIRYGGEMRGAVIVMDRSIPIRCLDSIELAPASYNARSAALKEALTSALAVCEGEEEIVTITYDCGAASVLIRRRKETAMVERVRFDLDQINDHGHFATLLDAILGMKSNASEMMA